MPKPKNNTQNNNIENQPAEPKMPTFSSILDGTKYENKGPWWLDKATINLADVCELMDKDNAKLPVGQRPAKTWGEKLAEVRLVLGEEYVAEINGQQEYRDKVINEENPVKPDFLYLNKELGSYYNHYTM